MTIREVIDAAGGADGFMREGQIQADVSDCMDELRKLLAEAVNFGGLDLDRYNESKRIMLRMSIATERIARTVRVLESKYGVTTAEVDSITREAVM